MKMYVSRVRACVAGLVALSVVSAWDVFRREPGWSQRRPIDGRA